MLTDRAQCIDAALCFGHQFLGLRYTANDPADGLRHAGTSTCRCLPLTAHKPWCSQPFGKRSLYLHPIGHLNRFGMSRTVWPEERRCSRACRRTQAITAMLALRTFAIDGRMPLLWAAIDGGTNTAVSAA